MKYVCNNCSNSYESTERVWRCECGSSLWCDFPVEFHKSDIKQNVLTMWRYDKAYPIKQEDLVATYNEGLTPLTKISWHNREILIKMDCLMPSGSFKDRGVVMVVNFLCKQGIKRITEDSSGNAGSSTAAYAALAGIDCDIFVPKGTSVGKLAQMRLCGANVHEVNGSRDDVALMAQASIGGSFYAGHNWHPLFVQGTKSVAYEVWEQNEFKAPDNVVCSVGNGSTLLGMFIGFSELLASNEIDKMPRIFGVQAENCNTIYRAFHDFPIDYTVKPTIAEGISLYRPSKVKEVVQTVKESNGTMVSVTEDEIITALKEIGKKGFYIEPTSAAAFAGAKQLIKSNVIKENEATVITASGNGLKATDKILQYLDCVIG